MVKLRLTSVDIRALVADLKQRFIGLRLSNVYDLNAKTYTFKFAKPDGKAFMLIESGIRMHSTEFDRNKSDVPSLFAMKLRKHLRTKRLESIEQLGVDRVVVLTFGSGLAANHLIVEFYALGNIILTDNNYEILTLLRTHKYDDGTLVAVREKYSTASAKHFTPQSEESIKAMLVEGAEKKETLKQLLNRKLDFGPALVEHTLLVAKLNPSLLVTDSFDSSMTKALATAIVEGEKLFDPNAPRKGYIVLAEKAKPAQQKKAKKVKPPRTKGGKPPKGTAAPAAAAAEEVKDESGPGKEEKQEEKDEEEEKEYIVEEPANKEPQPDMFEEFHPFKFEQFGHRAVVEFPSFDKCVDEFFSKIESQRAAAAQKEQEEAVLAKLEKVKTDQENRVRALQANINTQEFKAQLIEQNLADVDKAIVIIRSYVAQAMNWEELRALVKEEKKKGNPIAMMIHQLKLDSNEITLLLHQVRDSDTDEEVVEKAHQVDVELSLSAYANARKYYEGKKKAEEKKEKTIAMTDHAYRAAEKKTKKQMQEVKSKASINALRKIYWFEKFHWFISSENYIIISGKDAQQNEILVKRYMRKGDLYVHADLHGASSCIIKNPSQQPVPPLTLSQAGCMTVCRSAAWSAKVVTSAYWVHEHQVSKTAPTGEYLVTGSFMIRGKKNYLPPVPLVMGWGLLFKVDEASAARHAGERAVRSAGDEELEPPDAEKYGLSLTAVTTSEGGKKEEEAPKEKHLRRFERKALKKQQQEVNEEDEEEKKEEEEEEEEESSGGEEKEKEKTKDKQAEAKNEQQQSTPPAASSPAPPSAAFAKMKLVSHDEDDEDDAEATGAASKPKPRMSAAQRRKLKKGAAPSSAAAEKPAPKLQTPPAAAAKPKEKHVPLPRGKKSKLKKMKEKYADQDEEDRKIALKLLGVAAESSEEEEEEGTEEKEKETTTPAAAEAAATAATEPIDAAEREAARQARKERRAAQLKEQEEVNKILSEENVLAAADEHMKESAEINSLTGVPRPDDVILFCMTVSAPYTALQNFKHKVKLTPGSLKKGKAVKQALEVFMRSAEGREKDFIKAIPDPECMATMMAEVKVSTPGLYAAPKKKGGGGGKDEKQ